MHILKNFLLKIYFKYLEMKKDFNAKKTYKYLTKYKREKKNTVFYLGTPIHTNLGDLAQYYCIDKWIKQNLKEFDYVKLSADDLINRKANCIGILKKIYRPNDIIIFQSGYTTTDLGGCHDEMHCLIFNTLDNPYVLMMPQTIFFKSIERKRISSKSYSSDKNLLFLARDDISYDMATSMFNNIHLAKFPDIVTTLIGSFASNQKRSGIFMCCRDDSEKYYSDSMLDELMNKLNKIENIERGDTTLKMNADYMRNNIEKILFKEIERFSKYKLIITDRYHGTIFSLVSNTPVIVIKTNDHKVITGVNWFKGVYDNSVYYADNLDKAYVLAKNILEHYDYINLKSYFKEKYYDNLWIRFKEITGYKC